MPLSSPRAALTALGLFLADGALSQWGRGGLLNASARNKKSKNLTQRGKWTLNSLSGFVWQKQDNASTNHHHPKIQTAPARVLDELGGNKKNLFRTVEKSWISRTVWSQRSSKNYEKMPHFDHFPRPWEIDPYVKLLNENIYDLGSYTICEIGKEIFGL